MSRRGVSRRALGAGAALALTAAGLVAAQLSAPPAAAITTLSATTIAAGVSHSCTIQSGKAYCWGDNTSGDLGNGTTASSSTPVAVSTAGVLSGVTLTQIVAGDAFTCARSTSAVYCWGLGTSGQLGNGTITSSSLPVTVSLRGMNSITAGDNFACGQITSTGAAYCWGDTYGQLGNNSTPISTPYSSMPVQVQNSSGALKLVAAVTAGYYHACALDTSGVPYCWGYNSNGQLGNKSTANSDVAVTLSPSGAIKNNTVVAQISAGGNHTCAVDNAGNAYCWGQNNDGELGNNNSPSDSSVSVAITYNGNGGISSGTVTQITAGLYQHAARALQPVPRAASSTRTGRTRTRFGRPGARW